MNQLNGKHVNVVLSVECGRGMDFLRNHVHISANLNSRVLESDKIPVEENPTFNTELVWEIEKKDLRKIRSANQPLRVECISTNIVNRRERVGFALLSLRSAQIIPEKEAHKELHFVWHKLIGCQGDKKKNQPELYISLAVRDHLLNEYEACSSLGNMPFISEEEAPSTFEEPASDFPLKYFEDGHIQIGEALDQSIFYLNLLIKEVVNLDTLLPEALVFQENKKASFLSFKILGITIKTKPFKKEFHNAISLNEKVVVNIMSTQEILEEFFKSQNIPINFYCGKERLGITHLDLTDMFVGKDSQCFFRFPVQDGIVPFDNSEKSPYISIHAWVDSSLGEEAEKLQTGRHRTKSIFSNVSKISVDSESLELPDVKNKGDYLECVMSDESGNVCITKSVDTVILEVPGSPTQPFDKTQKYVVQFSLKYLIWKVPPKTNKIMFKILHPKAANCISVFTEISTKIGEEIVLNNIQVKMGYISTTNKIQKLFKLWKPKLLLTDENEKHICEEIELTVDYIEAGSTDFNLPIRDISSKECLARIGGNIRVKVSEISDPDEYEHLYLLPVILDELISVRELSDLHIWKIKERNRFDKELEKIKDEEVKRLEEEWKQKKGKLEEQLNNKVQKCQDLQEQLKAKLDTLKTEKVLEKIANTSNIYVSIFTDNWKMYSSANTKEVIELLSKVQRDNIHLKEIVQKQRQKLNKIEKSSLTKTQTSNLLQELRVLEEKFADAQNAKKYFKQQWHRACQEIHDLRAEDLKNIHLHIKQSKEALSQLSLGKNEDLDGDKDNDEGGTFTDRSKNEFKLDNLNDFSQYSHRSAMNDSKTPEENGYLQESSRSLNDSYKFYNKMRKEGVISNFISRN